MVPEKYSTVTEPNLTQRDTKDLRLLINFNAAERATLSELCANIMLSVVESDKTVKCITNKCGLKPNHF